MLITPRTLAQISAGLQESCKFNITIQGQSVLRACGFGWDIAKRPGDTFFVDLFVAKNRPRDEERVQPRERGLMRSDLSRHLPVSQSKSRLDRKLYK